MGGILAFLLAVLGAFVSFRLWRGLAAGELSKQKKSETIFAAALFSAGSLILFVTSIRVIFGS
jgi:hypothetical protein